MEDIRLKALTKRYGDITALPPVTARFPAEETTVLLGPSGCGKTTLFRLLMGLERPTAGSISGVPENISAVFQENRLLPEFSALTNIRLVTGNRVGEEDILSLLRSLGLGDWAHKPVKELSGGMGRRVAIARALLHPAELVLMDEPFKGLDTETRERVMALVQRCCRARTLLLITHDPAEAVFFGGQMLQLGNTMQQG
ncbi:MAG: ATP-binding cassette domain-containing protein [Eubacteriales bacterium]|nr:ATP-binding cassette domain-containing protein [Eubacteriales bacterium]MDY2982090.1 ATP-binding cassette domain-containing protein [Eubacteriales bacterium]